MVVNDLFEKTEKIKLKICFVSIFNTNFILILKSTKIWLENIATLFSFSEMIALRIFYHAHFFLLFFSEMFGNQSCCIKMWVQEETISGYDIVVSVDTISGYDPIVSSKIHLNTALKEVYECTLTW